MTEIINLSLGIVTLNRADLLDEALQVYRETWKNVHVCVVDNGKQNIAEKLPYYRVYQPRVALSVADSWNFIINRQARLGYSHVLILNDDVIVEKTPFEIMDWLRDNPADFYTGGGYYSFVMPLKTFASVGAFDGEFYPAWYEDTDYKRRLMLSGAKVIDSDFLKPEVLRTSKTGEKDPSLYNHVITSRRRYEQKWGGPEGQEKYQTAWNKQNS